MSVATVGKVAQGRENFQENAFKLPEFITLV